MASNTIDLRIDGPNLSCNLSFPPDARSRCQVASAAGRQRLRQHLANARPDHHISYMLVLRRTMNTSTRGEWSDQEFDVFDDDLLIGRILRSQITFSDRPWLWIITGRSSGDVESRGYAKDLDGARSELTARWETRLSPDNSWTGSAAHGMGGWPQ